MLVATPNIKLEERLREVASYVGNTPLYPITKVYQKEGVEIWAKLEWQQMGGSVKSRPAFNIIRHAILSGDLNEDINLLDASSGNTGIAYATFAAALGLKLSLCLPANASIERKRILKALGVDLVLTSPLELTDGAQKEAKALKQKYPAKYYYADQYSNEQNWKAHYHSTALEIWKQSNNRITHFVAGLGTTGTFTGTGRRLKELNAAIELVALQPELAMHGLEGWKHLETALVPSIYDDQLADTRLEIATEEVHQLLVKTARTEGLLLSPSSAANLLGAIKVAEQIEEGIIITVFPDSADRYSEITEQIFRNV